jgi:uncharacterized protein YlaI
MKDCEICGGSGKIRLPVRQRLNATTSDSIPAMSPIRTYPCPECGEKISQEKIKIIQTEERVDGRINDPDFLEHCRGSIAHQMVSFLHKERMITFTRHSADDRDYSYREGYLLRGKLGVLSPRVVATFEERVRERQKMVAGQVIDQAIKDIRNWGAFYSSGSINKSTAINILLECLHKEVKV